MPVRYPPQVVSYVESRPRFVRRWRRRLLSAPVIIPVVFVGAIVLGILIYYWTVFSRRIDNLLAGEVFTRTAGIYAAPKQLRVNETISLNEVIAFLKRAGYVDKDQQADTSRGRYEINGTAIDVEQSSASSVDGVKQIKHARIKFAVSGKENNSFTELDSHISSL